MRTYPIIEQRVGKEQRRRHTLIVFKRHKRSLRVFALHLHSFPQLLDCFYFMIRSSKIFIITYIILVSFSKASLCTCTRRKHTRSAGTSTLTHTGRTHTRARPPPAQACINAPHTCSTLTLAHARTHARTHAHTHTPACLQLQCRPWRSRPDRVRDH